MQYFIQTTGSPRNSAAPTPTTVCQYPARLRPSALGLEPGRSQIAYGASPPRRAERRYRDACLSALEYPR